MTDAELAAEKALAHEKLPQSVGTANDTAYAPSSMVMVILAWAVVGIPLLTGIWFTLQKAVVLFY